MKHIIIYGAGEKGRDIYHFFEALNINHLVEAFCDQNASDIKVYGNVPVIDLCAAKKKKLPFLIGVGDQYKNEVNELLSAEEVYQDAEEFCFENLSMPKAEYNRAYCAHFHTYHMDKYYEAAESDARKKFFWGDGICKQLFMKMNPENIIELACGRGRHVPEYINLAKHVTLVDVVEKNIAVCRERFKDYCNIDYYINNGKDLSELPTNTYTAIFTYDAMVHFELLDVAVYLQECNRVLVKSGMGLFHHSNNHADYRASFSNTTHGRNYMSKDIFAYLADRAGFEILQQEIVDWGGQKALDCLTLVRKAR